MNSRLAFVCAAIAALISVSTAPALAQRYGYPGDQTRDRGYNRLEDRFTPKFGNRFGNWDREFGTNFRNRFGPGNEPPRPGRMRGMRSFSHNEASRLQEQYAEMSDLRAELRARQGISANERQRMNDQVYNLNRSIDRQIHNNNFGIHPDSRGQNDHGHHWGRY